MRLFFSVAGWVATTTRQRQPVFPHRDIGAVVESAHQDAFRATEVGIGGQVEPCLHGRVIQHGVVFAPYHEAEAIQICHDGPSAVEAIQPQQRTRLRQAVRSEIATDGPQRGCQFLAVLPVASVSETAEPTFRCGLVKRRCECGRLPHACARCSQQHRSHPADAGREADPLSWVRHVGGLPELRAIDVEDFPLSASSIQQLPSLPLFGERAGKQILQKEDTQGFNSRWGEEGRESD